MSFAESGLSVVDVVVGVDTVVVVVAAAGPAPRATRRRANRFIPGVFTATAQ
jgi:hypothetical protein